MQVTKDKVVTFEFTVKDEKGQELDSSEESGPFSYIHGIGYLVPGLESAMEGKSAGDSFSVSIPPEDGYGVWDESMIQPIPKSVFGENAGSLQVGMQLQVEDETGYRFVFVSEVEDDTITIDGNHPLAGITLNFDVTVVDVRDATAEELTQGMFGGNGECDCGCHCNDDCQDDCQDDCCN